MQLAIFGILFALAQAASVVPYNYRRFALHDAAVLGGRMYIEGADKATGSQSSKQGDDYAYTSNTRSIPVTTSWTIKELKFTDHSNKKNAMPALNRVTLWADEENHSLYRFGGARSHGVPMKGHDNRHLWSYKPDSEADWSATTPEDPDVLGKFSYGVDGLSTFCDGVGFLAGGYGTMSSDDTLKGTGDISQTVIPGMLTYNASTAVWNNVSAAVLAPSGSRQGGQAVCATSFDTPLAVFIGGWNAPSISTQRTIDLVEVDMSNITLYDVRNKRWFSQKTTGDAPKASNAFCAVGVQSALRPNLPVYDIIVFGGRDHLNNTYGDVHILSMPSFQWTKLSVKAEQRIHHRCVVAGKSQMIVSGGVAYEWDWSTADPWKNGIGVLDLNKMAWSDKFDAKAPKYTSPNSVNSWYNTGSMKEMNWDSGELKRILGAKRYEALESSAPGTSSSGTDESSKKSRTGAIVGGVVGGVGFLIIVALVAFLYRRRQQKARQRQEQTNMTKSPMSSDSGGTYEAASTTAHEADSLPKFEADSLPQHEADGGVAIHEADSLPIESVSPPSSATPGELRDQPALSYDSQAQTILYVSSMQRSQDGA